MRKKAIVLVQMYPLTQHLEFDFVYQNHVFSIQLLPMYSSYSGVFYSFNESSRRQVDEFCMFICMEKLSLKFIISTRIESSSE